MNNAATGYPKFPEELDAIIGTLLSGGLSTNRDSVIQKGAAEKVFGLRVKISKLLGAVEPHEIILTASDTIALNMIMQGISWHTGDVLLIDAMSHNAIARPAEALKKSRGVEVIPVHRKEGLEQAVSKYGQRIRMGVFSHGSNVTGDLINAREYGQFLHQHGIPFVLDAAQTIGLYPIDVEEYHASAVTFAGHKGLNGPQGTGGFYIRKTFPIAPVLFGGTGTESMSLDPEVIYPESFEVGTPAMHDLMGLYAAIQVIQTQLGGFQQYRQKICKVTQYAYDELTKLSQVVIYGDKEKRLPVISFNIPGHSCKEVGDFLGTKGIICRTGIHCAGLAIRELGCAEEYGGTVRVSFGYQNTRKDVDDLICAIRQLPKTI